MQFFCDKKSVFVVVGKKFHDFTYSSFRYGRRRSCMAFFIIAGIPLLVVAFVPKVTGLKQINLYLHDIQKLCLQLTLSWFHITLECLVNLCDNGI